MSALCGCCVFVNHEWEYLPQVSLKAHATILSSAARTTLTQIFTNPSDQILQEVSYKFPLYDGVSVVGFQCRVGSRLLHSKVKSKEQANADYNYAVEDEQTAAIMEHTSEENDVFVIRIGNVHAKEIITVDLTFISELKQDAQTNSIRYTLPNAIAPRYSNTGDTFRSSSSSGISGQHPSSHFSPSLSPKPQGISIKVDVQMEKSSIIRELQSPSHSIKAFLGRTSSTAQGSSSFEPSQAYATLDLTKNNQPLLERDFVLLAKADGLDNPRALIETHPTLPGQRALMATLVPKFNLPPAHPEVVFVIDRSGSMGDKIATLKSALNVFLKSLPLGMCFNLCSFGSHHSFLWPTSKVYDQPSFEEAVRYVHNIRADMGGTEMQPAVEAVVNNRLKDKDLEVLLLIDGQIYDQQSLFQFIRGAAADNTARFFSLGLGEAASHSLVEGIARSGNGVSQSVLNHEELDRKVVRMLKGALTPHIYDYKLQVEYDTIVGDDFEVVEDVDYSVQDSETEVEDEHPKKQASQKPISIFDTDYEESDAELGAKLSRDGKGLPELLAPKILQAPYRIPPLYPFIRSVVYLLLDPQAADRVPHYLTFSASSKQGPLQLRIPISDFGEGETIHQLASRKAMIELEELHGWLVKAKDTDGNPFTDLHADTKQRLAARESQALGIKYQVTGKHCSFVALQEDGSEISGKDHEKRQPVCFEVKSSPHGEARFMDNRPMRNFVKHGGPPATSTRSFGNRTKTASLPFRGTCLGPTPSLQSTSQLNSAFGSSQNSQSPAGSAAYFGRSAPIPSLAQATSSASSGLFSSEGNNPAHDALRARRLSAMAHLSGPSGGITSSLYNGRTSPAGGLFGRGNPSPSTYAGGTNQSQVHSLIALQSFEGNWELDDALCDLLGCNSWMVSINASKLMGSGPIGIKFDNPLATLMVMGILENKHADSRNLWELVYRKAETWLDNTIPRLGIAGAILDANRGKIKNPDFLNSCMTQEPAPC